MQIMRKSPLTGEINIRDLPVTEEQMREWESPKRRMVQQIFPSLTPSQREFIMTGYTEEDWEKMFPKFYVWTLDSHDLYGEFDDQEEAREFAEKRGLKSYQILPKKPHESAEVIAP